MCDFFLLSNIIILCMLIKMDLRNHRILSDGCLLNVSNSLVNNNIIYNLLQLFK